MDLPWGPAHLLFILVVLTTKKISSACLEIQLLYNKKQSAVNIDKSKKWCSSFNLLPNAEDLRYKFHHVETIFVAHYKLVYCIFALDSKNIFCQIMRFNIWQ